MATLITGKLLTDKCILEAYYFRHFCLLACPSGDAEGDMKLSVLLRPCVTSKQLLVAAERAFLKRFLIGTFNISFSLQLAAPHEWVH